MDVRIHDRQTRLEDRLVASVQALYLHARPRCLSLAKRASACRSQPFVQHKITRRSDDFARQHRKKWVIRESAPLRLLWALKFTPMESEISRPDRDPCSQIL